MELKRGPVKVTVRGDGAIDVTLSESGVALSCSSASKLCSVTLTPSVSVGPVKITLEPKPSGVFIIFSTDMKLAEGWSLEASQQYKISPQFTPTEVGFTAISCKKCR